MAATGNLVSVSPASGPVAGGFSVDVVGTGSPPFAASGPGATAFNNDGGQGGPGLCTAVIHSATAATLTMPARAAGPTTINCWQTVPATTVGTVDFIYLAAPTITNVSPDSGPTSGGTLITIYGSSFYDLAHLHVTIGGVNANPTIISNSQITVVTPPGTAGLATIVVTNQVGSATATFSYVTPQPVVPGAVPAGRGRWRLTLHRRAFTDTPWTQTILAELSAARSRRLDQAWNTPAQLSFTLDDDSKEAYLIRELAQDVIAWRWDETAGADVAMFRGVLDHTEDQVSADSAVVNVVCHDYSAMMARRFFTNVYSVTNVDQDQIVNDLVYYSNQAVSSSQVAFSPGSYLPLSIGRVNPDGSVRAALSGQLRQRTYVGSTQLGVALNDLAKVINGFDYDVLPLWTTSLDQLRVFYPQQGVTRTDLSLVYGATVSAFTRTVSSADYANYQRVLGNNGSSDPLATQLFAEAWNSDANNVGVNPIGLWMAIDSSHNSDITQQPLTDAAQGDLNTSGLLVPSYTLTMRPGAYRYGKPAMGDTVPLVLQVGRLNVNTTVRVLGLSYAIGDDGEEDVTLTVGRSPVTLANLFTAADRSINALTRR